MLYCTTRTGITGNSSQLTPALKKFITKLKQTTGLEIAVGFGITQPSQLLELRGVADIAVVGSELIRKLDSAGFTGLEAYLKKLRSSVS